MYLLESIVSIEELNSHTNPLRITQYDTLSLGSRCGAGVTDELENSDVASSTST